MAEVELPDLPRDFEGYPYTVKLDAFLRAQATLPIADIRAHLSEAHVDEALILATCINLRADPAKSEQLDRILAQLPRRSGKHRRTIAQPAP